MSGLYFYECLLGTFEKRAPGGHRKGLDCSDLTDGEKVVSYHSLKLNKGHRLGRFDCIEHDYRLLCLLCKIYSGLVDAVIVMTFAPLRWS